MDDFSNKILCFDRERLIYEMEAVEGAIDALRSGEITGTGRNVTPRIGGDGYRVHVGLLRMYHLLEGALEINEGTQEEDVIWHSLYHPE